MKIKGNITDVNEEFLTFEIDGRTTVHLALLFLSKHVKKLPFRGSEVEIKSTHFSANDLNVNCVVLCEKSEVAGDFSLSLTKRNKFLQIVKELGLGALDLLEIEKNYRFLKRNIKFQQDISCEDILKAIVHILPKNEMVDCDACFTKVLPNFDLDIVSNIQFVGRHHGNYKDFAYWTFGNHWNWDNKCLFGYLYIHPQYGNICLSDFNTEISCICTNNVKLDIAEYINKYVLIKDFTVFSEIYNCKRFNSSQYVLFDISNITILPFNVEIDDPAIIQKEFPQASHYQYSFNCRIISKSLPCINTKKKAEFWLEVFANERHLFFCLSDYYFKVYPLLQEGCDYKVFHNKYIIKAYSKEFKTINPSIRQQLLPNESIFVPVANDNLDSNFLIPSLTTLQGVISMKRFADPLSSRTERYSSDDAFGSPGVKTHMLDIQTNDKVETIYLNNWENIFVPYGLLPQMEVIVKNVVSQNGKYFKSTALTSFEVVRYHPKIKFESINSFGDGDWDHPFVLGAGALLPNRAIVCSKSPSVSVLYAKINHQCTRCKREIALSSVCRNCGDPKRELAAVITLIVTDQLGESKVMAKNGKALLLLRLLLDAQIPIFEKWCKAFDNIESYTYCKNKTSFDETEEGFEFKKKLTQHFEIIDQYGFSLEFKCRKTSEDKGVPVYFLLDARKAS